METVVVTGGAGFIGSHLCEALVAQGHQVVALDNLVSGRESNLERLQSSAQFEFRKVDIATTSDLKQHFSGATRVVHLAALADIVPSIDAPEDYVRANVVGTTRVLEAARACEVKRFIYAASSSCYGIPDRFPTCEAQECRPQYPYALTKYLAEQAVLHWAQVYDLPALSLRFFNVYGRRARTSGSYGAVFGVFLAQKLAGQPLTIVGDGKQTRDFTHVSDVVSAIMCAADSAHSGLALNVGTGQPVSVNRIADLVGGPRVHIPKRPGEPDATHADTRQIRELLGWQPKVSIEDGVSDLLQDISKWGDAPVWTPDSIAQATQSWFKHLKNTG